MRQTVAVGIIKSVEKAEKTGGKGKLLSTIYFSFTEYLSYLQ